MNDMTELPPPFEVLSPESQSAPFVFSSPHSGRYYPPDFLTASRLDRNAIRSSEDFLVDALFAEAVELGAPLVRATYPRAYLDVNREPFELDPKDLIEGLAELHVLERQGDGRTPEGIYTMDGRVHTTRFGRALHISYPRAQDAARARAAGVEPGGGIFIHGLPRGLGPIIGAAHARFDWTVGCIAVTDAELAELWARVPDGAPIEILP